MNHGGNAINEAIQFGGNLEKGLRISVPFRRVRGGERGRERAGGNVEKGLRTSVPFRSVGRERERGSERARARLP
jgi:hypothetical protein